MRGSHNMIGVLLAAGIMATGIGPVIHIHGEEEPRYEPRPRPSRAPVRDRADITFISTPETISKRKARRLRGKGRAA